MNAVHVCARFGFAASLESIMLHQRERVNVDAREKLGKRTALQLACEYGHLECVKLLLRNGADRELGDKIGDTALHKVSVFVRM